MVGTEETPALAVTVSVAGGAPVTIELPPAASAMAAALALYMRLLSAAGGDATAANAAVVRADFDRTVNAYAHAVEKLANRVLGAAREERVLAHTGGDSAGAALRLRAACREVAWGLWGDARIALGTPKSNHGVYCVTITTASGRAHKFRGATKARAYAEALVFLQDELCKRLRADCRRLLTE